MGRERSGLRRLTAARAWSRVAGSVAAVALLGGAGGAAFGTGGRSYAVVNGDTLDGIAARVHVSPAALAAANHLADPNVVYAGQLLIVPGPASTRYRVAAGDTLTGIAARTGVSITALASANHLADPDQIFAGETLRIPGAGAVVEAASVAPAAAVTGPLAAVSWPASGSPRFPGRLRAHPARLALRPRFRRWAAAAGVPAGLLEALCWMESGWQRDVVSATGAVGIGQLEPSTVAFTSRVLIGVPKALDAHNADANIEMSAYYLAWMLQRAGGNVANALGGYYQGLSSLLGDGPLRSTRQYVLVVGQLWGQFRSG